MSASASILAALAAKKAAAAAGDEDCSVSTANVSSIDSRDSIRSALPKKCNFSLDTTVVHHIEHLRDLSFEERIVRWYTDEDFDKIKSKVVKVLRKRLQNNGVLEETDKQTFRGLEHRTKQGAIERQTNKVNTIYAVIQEQVRQREEERIFDPSILAAASLTTSAAAIQRARERALQDEEWIKEDLEAIREEYKKKERTTRRRIRVLVKKSAMSRGRSKSLSRRSLGTMRQSLPRNGFGGLPIKKLDESGAMAAAVAQSVAHIKRSATPSRKAKKKSVVAAGA